jgi:hypothetical protein
VDLVLLLNFFKVSICHLFFLVNILVVLSLVGSFKVLTNVFFFNQKPMILSASVTHLLPLGGTKDSL